MTARSSRHQQALTAIEVLVAIAVIAILVILMLPKLAVDHRQPRTWQCISDLKQVVLGTLLWVNDETGQYPWRLPLVQTGTLEFASSPQVFRHLAIMSNELVTPKILVCPADKDRAPSATFAALTNQNISYFVNLAAEFHTDGPIVPLFGDRNVTGGSLSNGFLRTLASTNGLGWSKSLHQAYGNMALADGSVSQISTQVLYELVQTSSVPLRLAIP